MWYYFSRYFKKTFKKTPNINFNQDITFAFKMHDMVKAINTSSEEDKLKSLETLRAAGHITETEFLSAKSSLSK